MTHRAAVRLRRRERIVRARRSETTLRRMASRIARFGGSVAPTFQSGNDAA